VLRKGLVAQDAINKLAPGVTVLVSGALFCWGARNSCSVLALGATMVVALARKRLASAGCHQQAGAGCSHVACVCLDRPGGAECSCAKQAQGATVRVACASIGIVTQRALEGVNLTLLG